MENFNQIEETYWIKIVIPARFPVEIPKITELEQRIPRNGNYHVNPDNTLCLGSTLRLKKLLNEHPDFDYFSEKCLIPYLYSITHKLKFGGDFPFGDLKHGRDGLIDDYAFLFGLESPDQVIMAFDRLGDKKRISNKKPCPCQCGKRLGRCDFHLSLNEFRYVESRSWFNGHRKSIM